MHVLLDYRPALRDRTGVGEWVHQLALNLLALKAAGDPAAAAVSLSLWTSSWRDRPTPSALRELEGAAWIDRRVPVRPLTWAWNRVGWPPVEALAGGSFDIVHSTTPLLLPARSGVRACTIYDLDFLKHPNRTRAEMKRDFPALVRSHAGRAGLVVTISEYSKREIHERLAVPADRITVCRPGVPSWIQQPAGRTRGAEPRHVLFLGTLEARKNVAGLLEAYRLLVERWPATPPMVLAGQVTPEASAWLAAAAAPPLAGRVTVEGYVSPQRRAELYAGARVLVLPSFDEGFGLPALEAMALGVPVVASTTGALPEVAGDAALLVDPADVRSLSSAIEHVCASDAVAARLREAGLARCRQFDWTVSARALLESYARGVASARGTARRRGRL